MTLANTAGVVLEITGFNTQIGSLTGGGATGGNVTLGAATLTVGGDNSSPAAYAGVISGTGGLLTKIGTGTFTAAGANTYTGATTINGGTLKAGVASVANTSGDFGNNSAVTLANTAGVVLDITGFNTQIGSLTGGGATGGNVTLGAATLTVGGDNTSPAAYAGVISGTGGSLTKIGTGTLLLSGTNLYTGPTAVNAGTLLVNGSITSDVTVTTPGALGGSGTITGNVSGNGNFSPGNSPGTMTIVGNFTPTGTVNFEVNSPWTAGGTDYDRYLVTGGVTLTGATLTFANTLNASAPAAFSVLTIINNDGTADLTAPATGPLDGATVTIGTRSFRLFYNGGDGNDVVLVAAPAASPGTVYVDDAWAAYPPARSSPMATTAPRRPSPRSSA